MIHSVMVIGYFFVCVIPSPSRTIGFVSGKWWVLKVTDTELLVESVSDSGRYQWFIHTDRNGTRTGTGPNR